MSADFLSFVDQIVGLRFFKEGILKIMTKSFNRSKKTTIDNH